MQSLGAKALWILSMAKKTGEKRRIQTTGKILVPSGKEGF
jgi:hypothetical protein